MFKTAKRRNTISGLMFLVFRLYLDNGAIPQITLPLLALQDGGPSWTLTLTLWGRAPPTPKSRRVTSERLADGTRDVRTALHTTPITPSVMSCNDIIQSTLQYNPAFIVKTTAAE